MNLFCELIVAYQVMSRREFLHTPVNKYINLFLKNILKPVHEYYPFGKIQALIIKVSFLTYVELSKIPIGRNSMYPKPL